MEVKRAFRKYLGPDDPGPFSDMINSMSFGCRHMKEYNRNGVFCLTANVGEGRVKVLRAGDVDYIWTELRQGDYLVLNSAWSPFIYVYTKTGALAWIIDPRTEGNQEAWYQAIYDAYGGFNLTTLYYGDQEGFDLQYSNELLWGYVLLLYRFSYHGGLQYSLTFNHTETLNVSRTNCEFALTRFSGSVGNILVGMTIWTYQSGSSYLWFRSLCELQIYKDEAGVLNHVITLSLNNGAGGPGEWFWRWAAKWMEEDFFYVDVYINQAEYLTHPRWSKLYKIDYSGTILASTETFQFPTNTGRLEEFDYTPGFLRANKNYVVHFSEYGQYIRVWDKDLNFIKNIAVDTRLGNYGRVSGPIDAYTWCRMIGFIANEIYILTGGYDWDGGGSESGGFHRIYVYDISKDSGDEFSRTFKIYPQEATVFGTTKAEVFEEGITLEGYKG